MADWGPLVLSFQVASVAALLSLALALCIGGWMASRRFFGRELVDALLTAPLVMPPTVLGYYLLVALGAESPLGRLYERAFGEPLVFSRNGAIVAATVGALPIALKTARSAFEAVDARVLELARTLGAGGARLFFTVRVPLAWRGLLAAGTLAFARALGEFGITLMVAGDLPGRTRTAPLAIYSLVAAHSDRAALLLSVVLTLLAVAALYAVNRLAQAAVRR